ncbi:MAG: DUF4055 domain-containing protein, partial [Aphanocapsa feldmannii 288cV]
FRCQSDYQELLYRTALPVGMRSGVLGALTTGQASDPVVLGPNSVIDLPEGASFQFVKIQARSLAEHRAWLEGLDRSMRRDALIPAASHGAPRTAMEISMAASQAYGLLQSQAIQKASMFSSLLQHWCTISAEPLPRHDGPALWWWRSARWRHRPGRSRRWRRCWSSMAGASSATPPCGNGLGIWPSSPCWSQ